MSDQHICLAPECGARANRVGAQMCEKHYGRMRRNGSFMLKPKNIPPTVAHTGGYLLDYAPDHPLSREHSRVYQHRRVFYEEHGAGPFNCHWCGAKVTWDDMHVDHLDDNKRNNHPGNLVSSCAICNQQRGHWKCIARHRASTGLTVDGVTLTINEWAAKMGIARSSIMERLKKGWSVDRAVLTPRGKFGPPRAQTSTSSANAA